MTPNAPTEAVLSNANTLMSVQRISKAFGDQRVLTDVSFDVVSGEILGLIGPNGAGKTTLLECIADLLPIERRGAMAGCAAVALPAQAPVVLLAGGYLALP